MDAVLDRRLRDLSDDRPGWAAFTRRMIDALESIRRDFDAAERGRATAGASAARVRIDAAPPHPEGVQRVEAALAELKESHDRVVEGLWTEVLRRLPEDDATSH
jgi:hypothetical protein